MVQIHPGAPILFEAIAKTEKRWPAKPVIRRFDSASPLHVLVAERIRTGLRNQHPYGIESSNLSGDTKFFLRVSEGAAVWTATGPENRGT